ncbi:NAD-dependent epimerase/dehydratase family protein [Inquilinus sp. NPDC058860]|uniref:NAD-dependent epimerase/dehydratase family protein n=1 Tax=Inquilinus sp. NPDC058860 TaxID=3346652 RepID=UPI00369E5B7A
MATPPGPQTRPSDQPPRAKGTVVVTGSSGFLGRAIIRRLAERYDVVGLDSVLPPTPAASFEAIRVDLTSDASVAAALQRIRAGHGGRIASVIHLAGYYDLSGEPSPKYEAVTIRGTERLLRGLQEFETGQFVFASTMLVHAPCAIGERIDEESPIRPKTPYPQSKADTEALIRQQHGDVPIAILRLAGVYDEQCHAAFLAQQIANIFERHPVSGLYPGDPDKGQPYLHLEDLVDAIDRLVERRRDLPPDVTLLLGEEETPSYGDLQRRIGRELHGEAWETQEIPKTLAKTGQWLQEDVLGHDPFIQPWMIDQASDHYALDISRARALLGWQPRHSLSAVLPAMLAALKADPPGWYRANKLNAAKVAASEPVLDRIEQSGAPAARSHEEVEADLAEHHMRTLWAHLVVMALGLWLLIGPFTHGVFEPGAAPAPPAAGHPLPPPEIRDAWLAASDMISGAAIILLSILAMARPRSWVQWVTAAVGIWLALAPLVFWTVSPTAYALDTLIGAFVVAFAVMVPAPPGISRGALASPSDLPLGWSYSPSTHTQRVPILAMALIGLLVSRYLAAYQLGHIDSVWDPVFSGGTTGAENGTAAVITSDVSKAFPIADAGFGAFAYLLDILTGAIGDRRRWRTMPWIVLIFGLLIVPLGMVSVGFIIIQPTVIGALCLLCIAQTVLTVLMMPYSVDEVWASAQFLLQSRRAGRPFWRTLFRGGPPLQEERDPSPDLDAPFAKVAHNFISGGVSYPWTLVASVAVGIWLMATGTLLGTEPPLAYGDHVAGCLVITIAVIAMAEVARPLRFLNVALGLWAALSPFLLDGAGTAAMIADIVAGLGLALLSLPRGKLSADHYGGWDRFIV